MCKKGIFLLLLLFLIGFAFADSLNNFVVPSSINLGNKITGTAFFVDSNGVNSGELCSFYFLDKDSNVLITRATSEYTTSTGRITLAGFLIQEPLFKRGYEYTLAVECGDATAYSDFNVLQRETIAHAGRQEWNYFTDPNNTTTIGIWFILGSLIIIFIYGIVKLFFVRVK